MISSFGYRLIPIVLLSISVSCASTRTAQEQYAETIPLVRKGEYQRAAEIIKDAKEDRYKEKDRVLYYLDSGMLMHWAGEYEESNRLLTQAEEGIEELFTKSISKGLSSAVLNDNALDYSGEDYEDVYLNVFKCLNYIASGDIESAHVEIRRVQIKLNLLEDKYKKLVEEYNASEEAEGQIEARENRFHNDVLARYLSLLLYRAEGALDDARIDLQSINDAWLTLPQLYDFEKPPLPAIEELSDGNALVNFISFTGLSPVKLADTLRINSGADKLFLTMEGQDEEYVNSLTGFTVLPVPGTAAGVHFKIQFPRLESRQTSVDRIIVKLDGKSMHEILLLEDMEAIARETFLLKLPLTVGRTIIRATVKHIAKETGKAALNQGLSDQGVGGAIVGVLAGIAAEVAVDASENADLRISQFFPSSAWAAEISIKPGSYHVSLDYWDGDVLLGTIDHGVREFVPGQLNLVESYLLK